MKNVLRMPHLINGKILFNNYLFGDTLRMILAGSSGSGKTYFAEQLFRHKNLKNGLFSEIIYYHPIYLKSTPVSWHDHIDIPITYKVGLPSKDDILEMRPYTCIVVDDAYDKILNNETMDQLFRVMSGKLKVSVIVMTQNFFSRGLYSRDIRNSCNYIVLFRNCSDANLNKRVCQAMGLSKAFLAAESSNKTKTYPYIFLDQSQASQASEFRLYTDIFGRYKIIYSDEGMKNYIISEADFKEYFKVIEHNKTFKATRHENSKQRYNTTEHTQTENKNYSKHPTKTSPHNVRKKPRSIIRNSKWRAQQRERFRGSVQKHKIDSEL